MILDTSAWIEFFLKTKKGERVKTTLESFECYTSIVSIAEISQWALRQNLDGKPFITTIAECSQFIPLNSEISFIAGELNHHRKKAGIKWGMIDSLIVATAKSYGLSILTKDTHFKDIPDVEIL